jgi:hypothetical protein
MVTKESGTPPDPYESTHLSQGTICWIPGLESVRSILREGTEHPILFAGDHPESQYGGVQPGEFVQVPTPPHPRDPSTSLSEILQEYSVFQATNPRDKVYAVLGLIPDISYPSLSVPDHHQSPQDLFLTAARYILSTNDPLSMLGFAGTAAAKRLPGLPSWVPDWASPPKSATLAGASSSGLSVAYCACGTTEFVIQDERDIKSHSLTFKGKIVDEVTHLAPVMPTSGGGNTIIYANNTCFYAEDILVRYCAYAKSLAMARDHVLGPYPFTPPSRGKADYTTPQSLSEVFWRTMIGDRTAIDRPAPSS